MWRTGLFCVVFAFGCGHGKGSGVDGGTAGGHLELSPPDAMVTIVNGAAQMQGYTATLVAADGTRRDVTSKVSFSLADTSYGAFAGANLTIPAPPPARHRSSRAIRAATPARPA